MARAHIDTYSRCIKWERNDIDNVFLVRHPAPHWELSRVKASKGFVRRRELNLSAGRLLNEKAIEPNRLDARLFAVRNAEYKFRYLVNSFIYVKDN